MAKTQLQEVQLYSTIRHIEGGALFSASEKKGGETTPMTWLLLDALWVTSLESKRVGIMTFLF